MSAKNRKRRVVHETKAARASQQRTMATAPPRPPASRTTTRKQQQHLKYTSPRCELEDEEFLPSQSLEDHDERWQHMSQQAGAHQQNPTILDLTNRRETTPSTLKVGVPPRVASRIRELHVDFHSSYSLPEWLDVVCSLFFTLQHLYTFGTHEEAETLSIQDLRMRRLYILYRLPDLLSIDGTPVTLVERQLARPSSPNGYKVKREDWVVEDKDADSTVSSDDEDSSFLQNHGDAIEVSMMGVVRRVSADPPKEEWEEPELPKPFEARQEEEQLQVTTTTVTKSVERAHQSLSRKSMKDGSGEVKTPTSSCGGLAAAFADANPCAASRRTITSLDEPVTVDYPTTTTAATVPDVNNRRADKYSVPDDARAKPSMQLKEMSATTPERRKQVDHHQRPTTPENKTSPSASLSSPFPIQFRSKSFNGALPSAASRSGLRPRKMSSPDLSPSKSKGTVDVAAPTQKANIMASPKSRPKQQQRIAERPPPCPPGSGRRVVPAEQHAKPRGRSWGRRRSKNSIRSTSIVDDADDDDDEDYISDDEDVIEHT